MFVEVTYPCFGIQSLSSLFFGHLSSLQMPCTIHAQMRLVRAPVLHRDSIYVSQIGVEMIVGCGPSVHVLGGSIVQVDCSLIYLFPRMRWELRSSSHGASFPFHRTPRAFCAAVLTLSVRRRRF